MHGLTQFEKWIGASSRNQEHIPSWLKSTIGLVVKENLQDQGLGSEEGSCTEERIPTHLHLSKHFSLLDSSELHILVTEVKFWRLFKRLSWQVRYCLLPRLLQMKYFRYQEILGNFPSISDDYHPKTRVFLLLVQSLSRSYWFFQGTSRVGSDFNRWKTSFHKYQVYFDLPIPEWTNPMTEGRFERRLGKPLQKYI